MIKPINFKKSIVLALFLVVLIVCWALIFSYTKKEASKLIENETMLRDEYKKGENLASLKRSLREIQEDQAVLKKLFIKEDEEIELLERIEGLAPIAGVSIKILTFDKRSEGLLLTIHSEGSFVGVYHLLALLENLPYDVSVPKTDFSYAQSGDKSLWKGDFVLILSSYLVNDKETKPQ